ncbi:hypothetical protein ACQP2Y_05290 [Actinoplanes sp. CA-051413]|uniref:hypothetical protein n=1 Tax=Actinoplanes sp. CA-051413 TaxID=3239899 RepID=UPI003D9549BA
MIRLRSTALLLAGGLSLAACSQPAAPAPASADPKAALTASIAGLTAGNYAYTVAMDDMQVTGTTDFPSASAAWSTTFTDAEPEVIDERVIGEDKYSRKTRDAPWEHLDLSRMPEAVARQGLTITKPDRTGATQLIGMVDSATMDGPTIRGRLAVTKTIGGGIATQPLEFRLEGARPTFTATVDDQGRLSRLVVDVPAATAPPEPAGAWTLDVTGYGTTPTPTRPTPTKEAPEDRYEITGT